MLQDSQHIPENNKTKIWYNDGLVDFEDASFHAITHALNYGTAVFEGVRVYDTSDGISIFHLDDHIDRLMESMKKIGITSPYSRNEIIQACIKTVQASGHKSGYIRPQVQFGLDGPGLTKTGKVDFFVFFWPLGAYRENPVLKIGLSKHLRLSPLAGDIEAKVVGYYVNSHFNHRYADEKGWDDAIMLDEHGNVAEASSSNIFYMKDGILYTPQTGHILKGITRKTVMEIAQNELGISIIEKTVSPEDLENADEIFLTGTAAEIDPVGQYNDQNVGDGNIGNITQKIKTLYSEIAGGKHEKYSHWHTGT